MFRAIALSIALTLAAGPTAGELCKALCTAQSATPTGCHHDPSTTAPSVARDSDCTRAALSVGTFFPEQIKRAGPFSRESHAVQTPRYEVPFVTTDGRPEPRVARNGSLANQPLTTALRL